MLTVRDLTVRYGSFAALEHIDLSVADNEIVCVLGPSGSGKSTLLRAIAGLATDANGRLAWDGVDLAHVPPHRRGFGLMFQDHALFPHRDVLGNVSFGLRMQRLARGEVDRRARAAIDRVGLGGFEHRRVSELSGGEQQRVALARALAPEPRLLMLDEPLGALDRALRDRLVGELRTLFTSLDLAVVFVTHDHDEAFALADRMLVMHEGRIVQEGAPADVWRQPADGFVARFLGWNVTRAFGGALLAIRPEGLVLTEGAGVDGAGVDGRGIGGVVTGRTFRRDHYLVSVHPDGAAPDDDDLRVAVSVDAPAPEIGDPVGVRARAGRRHADSTHRVADLHKIRTSPARLAQRRSLSWISMSSAAPALTRTILVVEDETPIAEALATRLRSEGFVVEIAADGPTGVELSHRLEPDLVVLDLMLPGIDGLDVCREIQRDRAVPVLMLTARDSETDLVVGLAVGADDYLTKPFSSRELVARVHALLRRVERRPATSADATLQIGDVTIEAGGRRVRCDGDLVHLTPTEFDLLAFLAERPARVFTREQLLGQVWGYHDGGGVRTVDSHVRALRRKLGNDVVRTVHGVGYAAGEASVA